MKSRWSDSQAKTTIAHYGEAGIDDALALRVYTTRLLGSDARLVLHGGGNTSLKTTSVDLHGDPVEVLCVKGSGWDMGNIEPAGLPAVRLEPLRRLRALEALDDFAMVNAQRGNLLDSSAPNPSVETLLHAFLPHVYVDHTHSTAVLSLTDQPDGEMLCRRAFGPDVAIVPYIMPGFRLAKKAAEVFEQAPDVIGLVLLKHGIFSFGASAREAYERMIELVSRAERALARAPEKNIAPIALPAKTATAAAIAPIIRGAVAIRDEAGAEPKRFVASHRADPRIIAFVNGAEIERYSQQGVVTPDHNIRIKNWPLLLPAPAADDLTAFKTAVDAAVAAYVERYHAYFARHQGRYDGLRELDPMPRVALVPGVGLYGLGRNAKEAGVAADLAENNIETITGAETIGTFEALQEADLFDVEYWVLEQAKLGSGAEPALLRQVAVITGGAGTIGQATARAFAAAGAEIALLDLDGDAAAGAAGQIGPSALGLACDVTDRAAVDAAIDRIAERFGGLDIVVSNAGAAWQGRIGEVDDAVLRQSFELNFFAHQSVAQAAVRIMRQQGTGGCLLFNTSKQAINPGADFGPYGLPKAATLFLVRQYALDHGGDGIRANAVNADRIRSGLLTEKMIKSRAKARGVDEESYMSGNLLGREVTADDVAQAFLHHALSLKTTGDVTTVDGGNIAAALR